MRFQCRIGEGVVTALPPQLPFPSAPCAIAPPARLAASPREQRTAKRRDKLARGAIAGVALMAVAGCATLDAGSTKPWKIEPVFSVTHSAQSSRAYYALGQYFGGSMAWDKAIDAYRKAIAADATNIVAYDALGVALAQADRFADAEVTLRQAVALAPDSLRIRNNLGYVLLLAGKPEEAVVVLQAVVDQDGSHAIALANLNNAKGRAGTAAVAAAPAAPAVPAVAAVAPSAAVQAAPQGETARVNLRVGYQPTVAALEERVARAAVIDVPVASSAPAAPSAPTLSAGAQAARQASRLEVSNGNGVTGMAARVGRWLAAHGAPAERLSNHHPFTQRHTVVQYRTGQEEAAQHVARLLPADAKAEPQPTPGLRSDVRVVLGHDWVQVAACLERDTCRASSASVAMAETKP
jgi:tetratricopeptide (TPR) repeat protein